MIELGGQCKSICVKTGLGDASLDGVAGIVHGHSRGLQRPCYTDRTRRCTPCKCYFLYREGVEIPRHCPCCGQSMRCRPHSSNWKQANLRRMGVRRY